MCSRAVSAVGWLMRANRRTGGIAPSANRKRSGCGSAAHRASSNSSRTSRPGCIGGPMVGYSTKPQPRRTAGWPWSATTCAGITPVSCATDKIPRRRAPNRAARSSPGPTAPGGSGPDSRRRRPCRQSPARPNCSWRHLTEGSDVPLKRLLDSVQAGTTKIP